MKSKDKIMVSHGGKTHPINEPCKSCEKTQKRFDEEFMTPFRGAIRREAKKELKKMGKALRDLKPISSPTDLSGREAITFISGQFNMLTRINKKIDNYLKEQQG